MILGELIMDKKEEEINKKYDNMIDNVKDWEKLAKNIPSSLKKSFSTLKAADTIVLKTRAMNIVKSEYKMMMLHLDIMLGKDYADINEETVKILKDYEYKAAKEAGYIQDYDEESLELQLHAPLFSRRNGSLVDASTEAVIQEIIDARGNMADLIDGILKGTDLMEMYPFSSLSLLFEGEDGEQKMKDLTDEKKASLAQEHVLVSISEIIEAWAKTLILDTMPLSSITPKNRDLSYGSTYEILSQNSSVSKLRQYRRAFDEKLNSKKDGVLIARHKVKWSGKLEDSPVINYTPVKRKKQGENKK